ESQEDFDVVVDKRARDMDLTATGLSVESSTRMVKTATAADIFKVTTAEGFELRATEWHKMYVDRDGQLVKIPLNEVEVGDRLLVGQGDFADRSLPDLPDGINVPSDFAVNGMHGVRSRGTGNTEAIRHQHMLAAAHGVKLRLTSPGERASQDLPPLRYTDDDGVTTVTSIEPDGIEDVYDVTVENGHSVIFNGIATGNCSEILQVSTASTYNDDLSYDHVGRDISCNLGSMNIAKAMDGGDLGGTVEAAVRALTVVSEKTSMDSVPSIRRGNDASRAIGLGQMNLHGFLGREHIHYGSPEALDFVSCYFAAIAFYAIRASNKLAIEHGQTFEGFADSAYADGSFFAKYTETDWLPETETIGRLFDEHCIVLPTREDWA